jgi:hypothetical protein
VSRLVTAEILKLRTTRLWWGLLLGVVAASLVGVLAQALIAGQVIQGSRQPSLDEPATLRAVYTAGLQTTYLFTLALGIITMAGEFRHQTITSTFLAAPHRLRVVLAKAVTLLGAGVGYGLAAMATGLVVGAPIVVLRGAEARLLSDGVPRAVLTSTLAVGLWALIGLGVGTLIRNQVVALLVGVGVAFLAEPLLSVGLNAAHVGGLAQYLPSQATAALVSPAAQAGGLTTEYLPWWGGGLALCAYAAVFGGVGALVTLRRDVT